MQWGRRVLMWLDVVCQAIEAQKVEDLEQTEKIFAKILQAVPDPCSCLHLTVLCTIADASYR